MLSREEARNGETILSRDGRALLSRFNPGREAERFIRSQHTREEAPGTVLIVGDLLGYLATTVRRLYPRARLVGIDLSVDLDNPPEIYDAYLDMRSGTIREFLAQEIDDQSAQDLLLLRWEPSLRLFPDPAASAMQEIRRRLLIAGGNISTLRGFGKRWVRNSILNYLFQPSFVVAAFSGIGAHLIASGPSLNRSRALLTHSGGAKLALASSLAFLDHHSINPDLIIQTDPGFYAHHHLRIEVERSIPVAMPLSAAPLLHPRPQAPMLLLNQQEPLEQELIRLLGLEREPLPSFPSTGTVAAAGLLLAHSLKATPIFVSGLDLCYQDIATHTSPHSFDPVFEIGADRLDPLYHRRYDYSRRTAEAPGQSRALKTYADWFAGMGADSGKEIYRLYPSRIPLPFPELSLDAYGRMSAPSSRFVYTRLSTPCGKERKARLIHLLDELAAPRLQDGRLGLVRELGEKLGFAWESDAERATAIHLLKRWTEELRVS